MEKPILFTLLLMMLLGGVCFAQCAEDSVRTLHPNILRSEEWGDSELGSSQICDLMFLARPANDFLEKWLGEVKK